MGHESPWKDRVVWAGREQKGSGAALGGSGEGGNRDGACGCIMRGERRSRAACPGEASVAQGSAGRTLPWHRTARTCP